MIIEETNELELTLSAAQSLARATAKVIAAFYEDPDNMAAFEAWKKEREGKGG